jgi:hypothetical protein
VSTNKKYCHHEIAEILLKVALNTISQTDLHIAPISYMNIIVPDKN